MGIPGTSWARRGAWWKRGYPQQAEICRPTRLTGQQKGEHGGMASGGHHGAFPGCRMFWNCLCRTFWNCLCRTFFTTCGGHRSWKDGAQISTWPHAGNSHRLPEVPFLLQDECQGPLRAGGQRANTVPGTQEASSLNGLPQRRSRALILAPQPALGGNKREMPGSPRPAAPVQRVQGSKTPPAGRANQPRVAQGSRYLC